MATRDTNVAVQAFRDVERKRWESERANERLGALIQALTKEEFEEYVRMTEEIIGEIARVEEQKRTSRWGVATYRTRFRMALNGAGKDHS